MADRPGNRRLAWSVLAVVLAAAVAAVLVIRHDQVRASGVITGRNAGLSWAPSPRDIGGLRAIATSAPSGYSLYTVHGVVHFLPGVDMGATVPGHLPGELAIPPADYRRWLGQMGWFGVRAVRVYTILPPAFYQALAAYDRAHLSDPIYLVQGVYLPNDNYLGAKAGLWDPFVTSSFRAELRDAVAAVNGTLVRGPTPGRASGTWTANVSRWIAGWIIGVEWDPYAVLRTNKHDPGAPAEHGRYFRSTPDASPTERWLAARMNDTATALAAHGWTVPIAFANWPTVDALHHPNEPNPSEDMVGVDPNHVLPTRQWPGGTFASYHVYPYYPDFLRYQPSYQHYVFRGQRNAYAGYLRALLLHSRGRMPVMITEFGVPSSLGSAHDGVLGWSQGGHTEGQAVRTDATLLRDMRALGMAGGFIFEWTDEWYKPTWNTQFHQLPKGRLQLWHDVFTNEQFFGLVAMDPVPTRPQVTYRDSRPATGVADQVRQVIESTDASYVHLRLVLARRPAGTLTIGLDTLPVSSRQGRPGPPPPGSTDRRADYALVLNVGRRTGQAWVRERLDPNLIDFAPIPRSARPAPRNGWRQLELLTDQSWVLPLTGRRMPMRFFNVGLLRYGSFDPARPGYDSLALWHLAGNVLDVRIPWAMAGLSDPSSHHALIPQGMYRASSVTIPGIVISIAIDGQPAQHVGTIRWSNWQSVAYAQRIKPGADAVRQAFAAVSRPS